MYVGDVIVAIDAKPTNRVITKVLDKVRKNECLKCSKKMDRRGLCGTCYTRFWLSVVNLSEIKKKTIEGRLIRKGLLLGDQMIRKLRQMIADRDRRNTSSGKAG